jgi:hypothetical protein
MVKVEGVSTLNLARINQEEKTGPTISKMMEKAPKLGFGNAFLIGLKALRQSATSEKTFASIRSELKKEVLETKVENRLQKLLSKFQGTNVEKTAVEGELRDQVMIRKLGLDTGPSSLQQSVDAIEIRRLGNTKNAAPKSKINIVFPDSKIASDPTALKAHFSNFIDRVQKEFALGNVPKESQLQHFENLFTDFVANSLSLTEIQLFDQSKLSGVVRQFRDENRTEKKEFMEVIKNVFSDLYDSESKISKKITSIAIFNLKEELRVLQPTGMATFLRAGAADQLNIRIYTSGGDKLAQASKDLVQKMHVNEKFKTVCDFLESFELNNKVLPKFKQATMTPDLIDAVGDLAIEMLDELKATENLEGLRNILSEVKGTFIDEVVSGKVSEEVAQRGNKMLGESNILLRFVTPQITTHRVPGNQKFESAMFLAGNFLMNLANNVGTPSSYDQDTATAFEQQEIRVKGKLDELLSSLNVPTSDELSKNIAARRVEIATEKVESYSPIFTKKVVQTLVTDLPKPEGDNQPKKVEDPEKSPPKPETNTLAKTNTLDEKEDIEENVGDLGDIDDIDDDESDDEDDFLLASRLASQPKSTKKKDEIEEIEDHVIDPETLKLQELADKKMLPSEQSASDELTDFINNLPQTPPSEEDEKRYQALENEFNEIMKPRNTEQNVEPSDFIKLLDLLEEDKRPDPLKTDK